MIWLEYFQAYDSDKTYSLMDIDGKKYEYREPTQKPIDPPYKSALALKRNQEGDVKVTEDDLIEDLNKASL